MKYQETVELMTFNTMSHSRDFIRSRSIIVDWSSVAQITLTEMADGYPLKSGDVVCFHEEVHGYLTSPSEAEPIAEALERISSLRTTVAFSNNADLWNQAMFRIELVKSSEATKVCDLELIFYRG